MVGWKYPPPAAPPTYEEAIPAAYDIHERVKIMDEMGVWGQVLYPNVGGFGSQLFSHMEDKELSYECVKIYNDWVQDWIAPYKERTRQRVSGPGRRPVSEGNCVDPLVSASTLNGISVPKSPNSKVYRFGCSGR